MDIPDIIAAVLGALFLWGGIVSMFFSKKVARWNDTAGPRWIRDFSMTGQKAYEGRTSPLWVKIGGILLFVGGILALLSGLANLLHDPSR